MIKLYKVVRACCSSGNCVTCLAEWNKARRKVVVQLDRLPKARAEMVARNWASLDARVVFQDDAVPEYMGSKPW